jgi:hypothetical protein
MVQGGFVVVLMLLHHFSAILTLWCFSNVILAFLHHMDILVIWFKAILLTSCRFNIIQIGLFWCSNIIKASFQRVKAW